MRRLRVDPWLLAILIACAALGAYQIDWGLPAGEHSWAVDGLEPVTVLGILHRSFSHWNSGWFYFKYPLAYPLLLGLLYAPYLVWLKVAGAWAHPATSYPYGFAHPEKALYVLALLGRSLSLLFTLGTVAAAYGIGRRLFGRRAARLAAFLVGTCYAVVYYAHTMNVDASYLFWQMLALYCGVCASQTERPLPWAGMGMAAAMAVSTKEQAFGFLLPLPFIALFLRGREEAGWSVLWSRGTVAMAVAAVGTALLANNALFNPLGLVARLAFLLGHPLARVDAPLKPVEFAWFKGALEATYLRQLWQGLRSALSTPIAWLGIAGAVTVWRRPRAALWLLVPIVSYYYLSLRGQQLITMRYALPLTLLVAVLAAGLLAQLLAIATTATSRAAVVALCTAICALGLARGVELDVLLHNDSRYHAEAWMRVHLAASRRGEVYQKPTYLPRFAPPLTVREIPLEERSVAAVKRRRPDFIVVSSESHKSISHRWSADWRTTHDLLEPVPEAVELVEALRDGRIGYRPMAVFTQRSWLLQPKITGLAPRITIYGRDSAASRGDGATALSRAAEPQHATE